MQKEINRIMQMFLEGELSEETEVRIQKWLVTSKDEEAKEQASFRYWNQLFVLPDKTTYVAMERVKSKAGITAGKGSRMKGWRRIAAILIPFLLIAGGSFIYYKNTTPSWLEYMVPYGEQQQLVLQDGSTVWLNAGTKLRYPEKFDSKERVVYLEGEAFFEVETNPDCPFFVESPNQKVKVTGTTFNVKAYPEDMQTITTLYSGKVDVYPDNHTSFSLLPGQQLTYHTSTQEASLQVVSDEDAAGWKDGLLILTDVTLEEIWKMVERYFNVRIINTTDIDINHYRYTARFVNNESPETVFTILQTITGDIRYEREGNLVYVKVNDK